MSQLIPMSSSQALTHRWLRQNLHSYPDKDRVFTDIDAVLTRYITLRPKLDIYSSVCLLLFPPSLHLISIDPSTVLAYDDGRTQLMLCVHGVLPISFRHASYNIPIALWIPRDYPKLPPLAYVVPTNDMLVRPGKFVDVSGKCEPEYIRNWQRKSEGCNLIALLEAMQDHFSREPPLFSKPRDKATPSPSSVSSITHDRPALPPKPRPSPHSPPANPALHHSPPRLASPANPLPIPPVPPPPPPPLPPRLDTGPPQYRGSQITPPVPSGYPAPGHTSPFHHPALREPIPLSHDQRSHVSIPTHNIISNPVPPPPPSRSSPGVYNAEPSNTHRNYSGAVASPPVMDLLDEDSPDVQPLALAPPRPPNPELLHLHARVHEKLKVEVDSLTGALALDAERLRALQADLLAGEPAIRDEMARLEAVRDVCRNVGGRMRDTVSQVETNLAEIRRKGDPEIDEMVCATTIVHNQLINLVAEDNAIEDTIYQLHRALNAGCVDLERFLRTTRVLAEEQFMKRALIEKITTGLSLDPSNRSGWS